MAEHWPDWDRHRQGTKVTRHPCEHFCTWKRNGKLKFSNDGELIGTITESKYSDNGITVSELGKFSLTNTAASSYSGFSAHDAVGNSITYTGKLSYELVERLRDGWADRYAIFDNPALFSGNNTFEMTDNSRSWSGFSGNDKMTGSSLDDVFRGGDGNDKLFGLGGDQLYGDTGNNTISAGDGADFIYGGAGKDILTGGAGADIFVFESSGPSKVDTINEFNVVEDTIYLDSSIFTAFVNSVSAENFVIGTKAVDANDFLIFNTKGGKLYYDADGNGSVAAVQIAVLKGVAAGLDADNFVLI